MHTHTYTHIYRVPTKFWVWAESGDTTVFLGGLGNKKKLPKLTTTLSHSATKQPPHTNR